MTWTKDKIDQLKELWKGGTIATEIAKLLGTSKNSVIAKANRLHCAPRKKGGVLGRTPSRGNYVSRKGILVDILTEMEPENPTALESLTPNQCKFPLGKEEDAANLFCGRERWVGTRKFGPNYCKYHVYVAAKLDDPRKVIRP